MAMATGACAHVLVPLPSHRGVNEPEQEAGVGLDREEFKHSLQNITLAGVCQEVFTLEKYQ